MRFCRTIWSLFIAAAVVVALSCCSSAQYATQPEVIDDVYYLPFNAADPASLAPYFNPHAKELIFTPDSVDAEQNL